MLIESDNIYSLGNFPSEINLNTLPDIPRDVPCVVRHTYFALVPLRISDAFCIIILRSFPA